MTDLRESVQYHSGNVDEVNEKLEDIDSRVVEIQLDEITEEFVIKTKKKLADLEDHSRRNNLHFDGFQEENNKTLRKSETIITDFKFYERKVRDRRRHYNWESILQGEDTEKWWDKK